MHHNVARLTSTDDSISKMSDLRRSFDAVSKLQRPQIIEYRSQFQRFSLCHRRHSTQNWSDLDINFILNTGIFCSIFNYSTFCEKQKLQHPNSVRNISKITETNFGQTISMMCYATKTFSYDPLR